MKHLKEQARDGHASKLKGYGVHNQGHAPARMASMPRGPSPMDTDGEMGGPPADGNQDGAGLAGLKRGGKVSEMAGLKAKHRLDKPHRAHGGAVKGKGKTTVNVIIAGEGQGQGTQGGPPAPPMAPPMAAMPPRPPLPLPPSGVGGPPGMPPPGMPMRKHGGRVQHHDDAAADKKMIDKEIHEHEHHMHKGEKETKLAKGGKCYASGGQVDGHAAKPMKSGQPDMVGGSTNGVGTLNKIGEQPQKRTMPALRSPFRGHPKAKD